MNKTDSTKTLELVPLSQRPHVTLPFFKMATTGKMLVVIALVMLPVIASGEFLNKIVWYINIITRIFS